MLIFITVLMLNVWAIKADDLYSNINILEELGKIKNMQTRMESLEKEMVQLRTENTAQTKNLDDTKIKMAELLKENEDILSLTNLTYLAQAKELDAMRGTTNEIKIKMDDLKQNEEKTKVAFSASLSASVGIKYFGPHEEPITLVYENVFTNIGNAYDTNTGIFTAPVKGVYFFNFVVFNPNELSTGVKLYKNGNVVVIATDNAPAQDSEDTTFNSVSLILEQGDKIYLQLIETRRIYTDAARRNTFSGHLLFTV